MEKVEDLFKEAFRTVTRGKTAWPLTLAGPPGIGKTLAALALADYHGDDSSFYPFEEICEYQMYVDKGKDFAFMGYREGRINNVTFWQRIRKPRLIIIDEIGIRPRMGWDSDLHFMTLKKMLDVRQTGTVFTTNMDEAALIKAYDKRIVSRLCGGTFFHCDVADKRLEETPF